MVKDENGSLRLDHNHSYYYQVQMQINIVESAEYCDFIVWKENDIYIERIVPDEDFWDQIVHKAETFFRQCILPEVFANKFTKSTNVLSKSNVQ